MRRLASALALLCSVVVTPVGSAHEVRPAYLEIRQAEPDTYDVLWKVPAASEELRLEIEIRFPAETHELGEPRGLFVDGTYLERRRIRLDGGLAARTIHIDGLAATQVDVLARVDRGGGVVQTTRITPDQPEFKVEPTPTLWRVSRTYLVLGVGHILLGPDHLLFVLGLLLIVPGRWTLLKTVTAFTVAHSLTLAVATLGYASAPAEPLNASIALSILFLGPEVVRFQNGETSFTLRRPWVVAFSFGLLHGFGFASGLNTLGMPAGEIPFALLCFNLGVEIGQVGFVMLILLLERSFRVLEISWPRVMRALPAYAVGSLGAYWFFQRMSVMIGAWK
jgi:hypothetical protein